MASWAKPGQISPPERSGLALVAPPDFAVRSIGLPRVERPEGWVKKVDRVREGKVWVGYFQAWELKPDGTRVLQGATSQPEREIESRAGRAGLYSHGKKRSMPDRDDRA